MPRLSRDLDFFFAGWGRRANRFRRRRVPENDDDDHYRPSGRPKDGDYRVLHVSNPAPASSDAAVRDLLDDVARTFPTSYARRVVPDINAPRRPNDQPAEQVVGFRALPRPAKPVIKIAPVLSSVAAAPATAPAPTEQVEEHFVVPDSPVDVVVPQPDVVVPQPNPAVVLPQLQPVPAEELEALRREVLKIKAAKLVDVVAPTPAEVVPPAVALDEPAPSTSVLDPAVTDEPAVPSTTADELTEALSTRQVETPPVVEELAPSTIQLEHPSRTEMQETAQEAQSSRDDDDDRRSPEPRHKRRRSSASSSADSRDRQRKRRHKKHSSKHHRHRHRRRRRDEYDDDDDYRRHRSRRRDSDVDRDRRDRDSRRHHSSRRARSPVSYGSYR